MKMHMDNFISMDRHFVYLTCMDCHFTYQTCIDHWLDWYISVVTGTPAHGTPVRIGVSNMKKKEKRKEWWRREEEERVETKRTKEERRWGRSIPVGNARWAAGSDEHLHKVKWEGLMFGVKKAHEWKPSSIWTGTPKTRVVRILVHTRTSAYHPFYTGPSEMSNIR